MRERGREREGLVSPSAPEPVEGEGEARAPPSAPLQLTSFTDPSHPNFRVSGRKSSFADEEPRPVSLPRRSLVRRLRSFFSRGSPHAAASSSDSSDTMPMWKMGEGIHFLQHLRTGGDDKDLASVLATFCSSVSYTLDCTLLRPSVSASDLPPSPSTSTGKVDEEDDPADWPTLQDRVVRRGLRLEQEDVGQKSRMWRYEVSMSALLRSGSDLFLNDESNDNAWLIAPIMYLINKGSVLPSLSSSLTEEEKKRNADWISGGGGSRSVETGIVMPNPLVRALTTHETYKQLQKRGDSALLCLISVDLPRLLLLLTHPPSASSDSSGSARLELYWERRKEPMPRCQRMRRRRPCSPRRTVSSASSISSRKFHLLQVICVKMRKGRGNDG